jgi:aspartate 1-decarboxylase
MLVTLMKAKLHRATVTQADLDGATGDRKALPA